MHRPRSANARPLIPDEVASSAETARVFILNHDAAIKAFLAREATTLEVFLPDLEDHELMFSLAKHFDDGPQIPGLVIDAYRYFTRLARDFRKRVEIRLFGRYPTYSFYKFADRAVVALYSNATARKDLPTFEINTDSFLGRFLTAEIGDLKKECRRRAAEDLEAVIRGASGDTLGDIWIHRAAVAPLGRAAP